MGPVETLSLGDKVLLAGASLSNGDIEREFTGEGLVVAAWRSDNLAFGLRGYEGEFPDSNKVYTKLDGQTGLVTKGLFAKSGERMLRVTIAGLARAVALEGGKESNLQAKLDRRLQDEVSRILSHPVFQEWLRDRARPTKFRSAGHFWGIAPGTPSSVVRSRILGLEATLAAASEALASRGLAGVVRQRGRALFEQRDIELALEFQRTLRGRFRSDLRILDPDTDY